MVRVHLTLWAQTHTFILRVLMYLTLMILLLDLSMGSWPYQEFSSVGRCSTRSSTRCDIQVVAARTPDSSAGQVLELIEEQGKKVEQRIHALLLVGGFAASEYLFQRVHVRVLA